MKIHSWEAQLFHADRRTVMTKLIDAIRNFTNAPTIYIYIYIYIHTHIYIHIYIYMKDGCAKVQKLNQCQFKQK